MIRLTFACGCQTEATGEETSTPECPTHHAPIMRLVAPPPRVTGPVQSPLKEN